MSLDAGELRSCFYADNASHAQISRATLKLVEEAERDVIVAHLDDGTQVLRSGSQVFGAPFDDEVLFAIAKRAESPCTFVVFGLGMGHTVRGLSAWSSARIVVYEPDPGALRCFLENGPSDLGEVPVVCTLHDLTQIWPRLSNGKQNVTLVNTPGYSERYPEQAQSLRETLAELVQRSGINDATHRMRSRVWVQDVLANIDLLREHPSFLALARQYRGVPAFIVGAGPSLGKNGRRLAEAAQKGIVIAVNSSARALDSYGVEPQVLACMESIDVSPLFEGVSYIDRVARAISLSAHPRSLRVGKGPLLPVFESIQQLNGPLSSLLGFPGIAVSGSVSTLAFALAERLGCSPIVLVGQDLAYTDGKAYAQGTAYQDSRVHVSADGEHLEHAWCDTLKNAHKQGSNRPREPLQRVPAWGGEGQALSTVGFSAVRDWFETASRVLAQDRPETRLVNATEGGARVLGFEECTLASLLETLPELEISAASLAQAAARAQAPLSSEHIARWCGEQALLARAVRAAARRVRRLGEASSRAIAANDVGRITKAFKKLEVAELELKRAVLVMPFADAWSHAAIDRAVEAGGGAVVERDDRDSAERAVLLERSIAQAIEDAGRELELALSDLETRLTNSGPRSGLEARADPVAIPNES